MKVRILRLALEDLANERRFGGSAVRRSECVIAHPTPAAMVATMNPTIDPKLLNDPVFQRVLADARSIQDRFAAEPVYARTGKGFLKSAGVAELKKIKAAAKTRHG